MMQIFLSSRGDAGLCCSHCSRSLAEACSEGDVNAVRKLLIEGRSVNEHTEEGESLLCLACSAGYYELAQVCARKISLEKNSVIY